MNFKLKDIIVFEDDSIIALNKPPGVLSIPDREASEPSLKALLQQLYPGIYTVHRLDKDTSGLIILQKQQQPTSILAASLKKEKR